MFLPARPSPAHEINHKDGNHRNNRADNLEWVTRAENMAHAARTGLMCHGDQHPARRIEGWSQGEKNGRAKLTADRVALIKRELLDGAKVGAVAKKYGVSSPTIGDIKAGRHWAHVAAAPAATASTECDPLTA